MRKILRALGSGVGITLIVTLVLSAVLWFLGPFFAFGDARPFEGLTGLLVGLGVLWILALLIVLVLLIRAQKRDESLAAEIIATPDTLPSGDIGVGDEMSELREKLRGALGKLRRAKGGRRHLAQLPWYVIIGPPGAGKTTAIVNSGLSFPLAEDMGAGSIGGVGGTRNCDWWFTDNAVLVDTAGRYTTQESDASADNAGWLGFLGLLKKYRKRQPINGAIVAISLSDLLMQDPATQKAHGAAIRRRLHELREKLGVRFPVYVLFTKADLIAGFTETFERLPKEAREQVWGFTLPLPQGGRNAPPAIAAFDEEFGLLVARLNAQTIERMQGETDSARRSLIAGFPGQLASMRQIARDFLTEVLQENRYEHRQMLRGVYFASGTQEGTPIDRLMMGMAQSFGIGRQAIGTGRGTGRSFFLTRLFDGVIFPEAGLVSSDDRVERRYRWMRRGAVAATLLVAGGVSAAWFQFWQQNGAQRQQVSDQIEAYRIEAAAIPVGPVADSDLPLVVPALEHLRIIPGAGVPVQQAGLLAWGLDQSAVIGNEAKLAWRDALNRQFLPRLLVRLEDQMQSSINDPVVLFDLLKVYMMLGQIGPMDEALVKEYFRADWERLYSGASREDLRNALALHLDALLAGPMKKIDLNNDLVAQVQDVLTRMPQAQRIYNGIVQTDAARALPAWRPTDIGGPAITRAFTRSSGKPLNDGIEGIYTRKGFYEVFLPEALRVSAQIQRDAFVLGPTAGQDLSDAALTALSRDVLSLYYNDYVARYDQMLSDLDIIPLESLPHAVEVTNVLSGPASPLRNILGAIAEETRLTVDPGSAPKLPASAEGALDAVEGAAAVLPGSALTSGMLGRLPSQSRKILDALSAPTVPGGEPVPPGAYVEERFAEIQTLVTAAEGAPSPLDTLIASLTAVNQELNKLAFSGGVGNSDTAGPAIQSLVQAASQLPGPIQRWVSQVVSGSSGITADGTRAGINAKWQAEVLPLCQQATDGKYPFARRGAADISIQDFTTLFAPAGLIDKFFQENLAEHVDQRARPWTFKKVNDADLGISPQVLLQMQHAAEIRDAFFAGGPVPKVQFQMTPEALDPKANAIVLELDGQRVAFAQGEGQPTPSGVTWPGAVGLGRVTMDPPLQGGESVISRDGPWALFRLLDAAEIRRTNVADRTRVIFKVGGRIAIFGMQSGSVKNPFALAALTEFKCPASF